MQYYFSIDGNTQQGPLDPDGMRAAGVNASTMVWREGMPDWKPAGQVPELAGLFAGIAPPPAATYSPPPPGGSPPQPGPHVQQPLNYSPPMNTTGTNGLAIASLICSICGLTSFCCCGGIVASILGVIFGHLARGQIRRGQGGGDGVALAGLVLGYIGVGLFVLGIGIGLSSHGFRSNGPNFNWHLGKPFP